MLSIQCTTDQHIDIYTIYHRSAQRYLLITELSAHKRFIRHSSNIHHQSVQHISQLHKHESIIMSTTVLHPFNGLISRTTWVSKQQKSRTIPDFNEARDDGWQWHQLDHMQIICTLLKIDNHASTSPPTLYRPDALPDAQSTASKH